MINIACNDWVLILRDETESEKGGLWTPPEGRVKPHRGLIHAVGSKTEDENIKAAVGQKCLFHPTAGWEIEYEDVVYLVLRDKEIIALP